jgi:hypothetical protein
VKILHDQILLYRDHKNKEPEIYQKYSFAMFRKILFRKILFHNVSFRKVP